jgi:hypothetical protein
VKAPAHAAHFSAHVPVRHRSIQVTEPCRLAQRRMLADADAGHEASLLARTPGTDRLIIAESVAGMFTMRAPNT